MKKLLLILFLLFTVTMSGMALTYTSRYPTLDDDHVKATTKFDSSVFQTYYTTDPTKALDGAWNASVCWASADGSYTNQRFHIDLGSASQNTFDEHVGADQADPKFILVTNTTAYRYYAFKIADDYGGERYIVIRRIELQTEDDYGEAINNAIIFAMNF